ncbi:MAG: diacylglycerol kinase family protein [Turicibacter sp.]|nr:diacylglycerol kinase family protein [Turicibacter sp.]
MKNSSFSTSFIHAIEGIRTAIRNERNFKIHLIIAALVVILCIFLPLEALHIFMVVYAIFSVLCTELINTAIEAVVDLYCDKKHHPLAKIAKDCAAGAVLLASIQAILIAMIVAWQIISG